MLDESFLSVGSKVDVYGSDTPHVTQQPEEGSSNKDSHMQASNKDTYNNLIPKHKCHQCDFATTSKYLITKHRRQQHKDKEAQHQYRCDTCSKGFPERYLLKNHVDAKHNGIKWICEFCAKSFEGKGALGVHKRKSHTNDATYKCSTCRKSFMDKNLYVGHISKHSARKLFSCGTCKKSFQYKNSLNMHEKACHGNKSFPCAQCGMKFTCSKVLKDHIHGKHRVEKKYFCQCGKSYRWRSSLCFHKKKCMFSEKSIHSIFQ